MGAFRRDAAIDGTCIMSDLAIQTNRSARKYTRGELFRRVLWGGGKLLFRFSPRVAFGWRRWLLRLFGAHVGRGVNIYQTAVIYFTWNLTIGDGSSIGEHALVYDLGPVTIGRGVTVSQRSHLCAGTHDHRRRDLPLLKPPRSEEHTSELQSRGHLVCRLLLE